jgi:hypothetical protein
MARLNLTVSAVHRDILKDISFDHMRHKGIRLSVNVRDCLARRRL